MASYEKLPSGRFRGIYQDHGQKRRVPGTFRLQSEALDAAKEKEVEARRRAQLAVGTLPATITWDQWWELLSPDRQFESDTTYNQRYIVTKHISPQWGDAALNEINRKDVQDWVNKLTKQRTPTGTVYEGSYVRHIYTLFRTTINAAINQDPPVLLVSPLVRITLPPIRKKAKQFVPMAEAPELTAELRCDYADVVAFVLETGLRPGELAGLHDDQVDVAGALLTVATVYVRRAQKMRGHPKDDDVRVVPLSARALSIYQRRTKDRDMRQPCGVQHYHGRCTTDLVFRTEAGGVVKAELLRTAMARAADRAGLSGRTGYALRRGFATRLARGGIDLFELMDIMGWSDPALAREYVQESPGARDRLMAALGDPSATGLRVVGQQDDRGIDRGTKSDGSAPEGPGKRSRRKTS